MGEDDDTEVIDRSVHRFTHVAALDGLRGLAVTMVVLYHFAPDLVPGGFLGVDVFFVLSGFLISSLALGEHRASGAVSIPAFFARRARRLLPAAIATIVVAVAIAVVLDPATYRSSLRGQAVASLLYVNNWWAIAQRETYQVVFGAESPLTHFWSLSIEEQFYLVFPFLLLGLIVVVRRRGDAPRALARSLAVVTGVGAIMSAALMGWLYDPLEDPSRLYYGTDTRLQAVLVGVAGGCAVHLWREGWLSRIPRRLWTPIAALATVALLVSAWRGGFLQSWLYRGGFLALAIAALLAVIAVVLHRGLVARLFEWRVLVTLGLFSYGIYLWHWPVKVFVDHARTGLSGVSLFAVRIAITAAATIVSARVIEAPFRSPRTGAESSRARLELRSPRGAWIGALAMVMAVVAVWIVARPIPIDYANTVADAPMADSTGPLRVMWTGDSVAWTMGGGALRFPQPAGYETVYDPARVAFWNLATYPCPMIAAKSRSFGVVRSETSTCWSRATTWPVQIEQFHPDVVVWNGALFDLVDVRADDRWVEFGSPEWDAIYLDALDSARAAATSGGTTFVLVGQPVPESNPSEKLNEALLPENIWRFEHLRELERSFAEAHRGDTRFVDLDAILCPTGTCPTTTPDGVELRPDGIHWSLAGARAIAPVITDALLRSVGRPAG